MYVMHLRRWSKKLFSLLSVIRNINNCIWLAADKMIHEVDFKERIALPPWLQSSSRILSATWLRIIYTMRGVFIMTPERSWDRYIL